MCDSLGAAVKGGGIMLAVPKRRLCASTHVDRSSAPSMSSHRPSGSMLSLPVKRLSATRAASNDDNAAGSTPPIMAQQARATCAGAPAPVQTASSRRGKYSRVGKGKRLSWDATVSAHLHAVVSGRLLTGGRCSHGCPNRGNCSMLFTLAAVQRAAVLSFGDGVLPALSLGPTATTAHISNEVDWKRVRRNHKANEHWFQKALESVCRDDASSSGMQQLHFRLDGVVVCAKQWGHLMGVRPSTMECIITALQKGQQVWKNSFVKERTLARRKAKSSLVEAAAAWWAQRFTYYEMVTKEGDVLLHA